MNNNRKIHIVLLVSLALIAIAILLSIGKSIFEKKNIDTLQADHSQEDVTLSPPEKYNYPELSKPDSLLSNSQFKEALVLYDKAIDYFLKENEINGIVAANSNKGYCCIYLGDFSNAVSHFEKALNTGNRSPGQEELIDAEIYYGLGICYRYLDKPDRSLENQNRSLRIKQTLLGEHNIEVVKSYLEIGNVHRWIRYDYYNAERYYYSALKILENLESGKELDFTFRVLYNLTTTSRLKGDYEKALTYGLQALQIVEKLEKNKTVYLELCTSIVANIYYFLSEYEYAISYYREAIRINENNKNYLSDYYINIGLAYTYMNKHKEAINYCDTALNIFMTYNRDDLDGISHCHEIFGLAHQGLGNNEMALNHFRKCLRLRESKFGRGHMKTDIALELIGNHYRELELNDSALYYYQQILFHDTEINPDKIPTLASVQNKYYLLDILVAEAMTLMDNHIGIESEISNLGMALSYFYLADSLISISKHAFERESSELHLTVNVNVMYYNAITCSFRLEKLTGNEKYKDHMLFFMEKNKARNLLDHLTQIETYHKIGIPDSLINLQENLKFELEYRKSLLAKKLDDTNSNIHQMEELNAMIYTTGRDLEKLKANMTANYPAFYQIKYGQQIPTIIDLKAKSKELNATLIQYIWNDSILYAISISNNDVSIQRINNVDSIYNSLMALMQHVQQSNDLSEISYQSYIKKAHFVFRELLQPLLSDADESGFKNLIIIPDGGILTQFPFEILLTDTSSSKHVDYKNLNYLIKKHRISYAYSLSILNKYSKNVNSSVRNMLLFSYSGSEQHISLEETKNESDLPGTYKEARSVSRIINGDYYWGAHATESQFKKSASEYDIIHLALHGSSGKESNYQTKLIFQSGMDTLEDHYLYAYELYNLRLKARLVVLSSCETGLGKEVLGEGVFSMGRAFAYTGCPSLVMSLWKINDQATADMMTDFYKEMSIGKTLQEAMYQSKINYLEQSDEFTAHPAHWAAFIVLGDISPIQIKADNYNYFYATVMLFIVLAIAIFLIKQRNKEKSD